MKKKVLFVLMVSMACPVLLSEGKPDFAVTDITVQKDRFVYLKIENRSPVEVRVSPLFKERPFLTLYIDDLKRAEYKLKYLDSRLFKGHGKIQFRTNFRIGAKKRLKIKGEVNGSRIFPETNYLNNILTRDVSSH